MSYRILIPEGLPLSEHATYAANAIQQHEAREAQRRAADAERKEKAAQIQASLEQIKKENAERDRRKAEAQRERDERSFEASLRASFFEASPMASESDWNKAKADLRAAALKERALDQFRGRESLVERNKEILMRSGRHNRL